MSSVNGKRSSSSSQQFQMEVGRSAPQPPPTHPHQLPHQQQRMISSSNVPISQSMPNHRRMRIHTQQSSIAPENLGNGSINQPLTSTTIPCSPCLTFIQDTCHPICITPHRLAPWSQVIPTLTNNNSITIIQSSHSPSLVESSTLALIDIFKRLKPSYSYDLTSNPRRVLTKPARPVHNNGVDNERWDLILRVGDTLGDEGVEEVSRYNQTTFPRTNSHHRYVILDLLGHGTFGQVVKARDCKTGILVAIKVIKNQTSYFNQSMMEVTVLDLLNNRHDPGDQHHIIRMRDTFVFKSHLCIVVELLGSNLYELIKQNGYRGFSLGLCRVFLAQCLDALQVLRSARIIHCDLKPENILLVNPPDSPAIKIIDFGSACHEHQTVYTYIQSRFYRSPEVILGLPYSSTIDMWSLGCIAAELFLGLPAFPGSSNYDQLARIIECMGMPPKHMLDMGKDASQYFARNVQQQGAGGSPWHFKPRERYNADTGHSEGPSKKYFSSPDLRQVILTYNNTSSGVSGGSTGNSVSKTPLHHHQPVTPAMLAPQELAMRECFVDFCYGLLQWNPVERWSPAQAMQHPFISGRPFQGHFNPKDMIMPLTISPGQNRSAPLPIKTNTNNSTSNIDDEPTRMRSNTLATLRVHEVPPELQRLAAAVEATAHEAPPPANPPLQTIEQFSLDPETGLPHKTRRGASLVVPTVKHMEEQANEGGKMTKATISTPVISNHPPLIQASNQRRASVHHNSAALVGSPLQQQVLTYQEAASVHSSTPSSDSSSFITGGRSGRSSSSPDIIMQGVED